MDETDQIEAWREAGVAPGQIVKRLRDARGWTQEELGKRADFRASDVSKMETGSTKFSRVRAKRLARALGVEPSLLLPPAEPQPTLADVLVRLEEVRTELEALTGNQERLLVLVEHLAEPGRLRGGQES